MEEFGCFGACQARVFEGIRGGSGDSRKRGGAHREKIQDSMSPGIILLTISDGAILFLSFSTHYLWPLQSLQRRENYRIPSGRLLSWKAWAFQSQCDCRNIYHINSGKEEAWEAGPGRRQETWELLWFNLFFCFIFKNPLCKDVWSPSF